MPCYENRNHTQTEVRYESGIPPIELNRALQENDKLSGLLCAVFNELDRRGIMTDVAACASRSGLIDVMGWLEDHSNSDVVRLAKRLHAYSKDEQAVMLKLLKEM